jgi:hypothetical protein
MMPFNIPTPFPSTSFTTNHFILSFPPVPQSLSSPHMMSFTPHSYAPVCSFLASYFSPVFLGSIQQCPDKTLDNRNISGRINPTQLCPNLFNAIIITLRRVPLLFIIIISSSSSSNNNNINSNHNTNNNNNNNVKLLFL